MRRTIFGTFTEQDELSEEEKSVLYIKESAEKVGIECEFNKTAISFPFIASEIKAYRDIVELKGE